MSKVVTPKSGSTMLDWYCRSNSLHTGLQRRWPVKIEKLSDKVSECRGWMGWQMGWTKKKRYDHRDTPVSTMVPTPCLVKTQPALGLSPLRMCALPKPKKWNHVEMMSSNTSKEGKSDKQKPGIQPQPGAHHPISTDLLFYCSLLMLYIVAVCMTEPTSKCKKSTDSATASTISRAKGFTAPERVPAANPFIYYTATINKADYQCWPWCWQTALSHLHGSYMFMPHFTSPSLYTSFQLFIYSFIIFESPITCTIDIVMSCQQCTGFVSCWRFQNWLTTVHGTMCCVTQTWCQSHTSNVVVWSATLVAKICW